MSRPAVRTDYVSLDTIAIIKRLYPQKVADFYHSHLHNTDNTLITFYAALRGEPVTPELNQLIESAVSYELRYLGFDRDTFVTIPPLSTLLQLLEEFLDPSDTLVTRNIKSTPTVDTETQSRLYHSLKFHRARLSTLLDSIEK